MENEFNYEILKSHEPIMIFNNSKYFYHISKIVYNKLKNNNIDVYLNNDLTNNRLFYDNNYTYLFFVILDIENKYIKYPDKYIVYNFEQLCSNKIMKEYFWYILRAAKLNLDYSKLNEEIMKKKGIDSIYLRFDNDDIYRSDLLKCMKIKKSIDENNLDNLDILIIDKIKKIKIIDVLFIGLINERRYEYIKLLEELKSMELNIEIIDNIFMNDSLHKMAQSKILLNIHYYDGKTILEIPRIYPGIKNLCIILSEKSDDKEYDNILKK